ncbi:MAG: AbrB/MazE/SpoVT family DNA-binding domain-containing protein [Thaumarchaeota archaeon]|nr:AbrB/MazE/SpoVT family DNA-binding domain-containing protein [Nitrososphaerota archaeon]
MVRYISLAVSLVSMDEHKIRVSTKGQVVIPEEIRKRYGIIPGMELTLKPLDKNRIIVEKVPRLSEFFGFLGKAETIEVLRKERQLEFKVERERDEELRRIHKKPKQQRG